MRTTVVGVRLTDYQREKLKKIADKRGEKEADVIRVLIDMLLDEVIVL
jgi:predicted DNA-binding protein